MPLFFGLSFVGTKVALRGFNPLLLATTRFVAAGLVLYAIWRLRRGSERLTLADYKRLALLGFVSLTIYFCFETIGISRTTASAASILIGTIPIFVSVLGALFLKERNSTGQWAGVLVSFAGVVALVILGGGVAGGSLFGNLLVLGAALCASVYEIMARRLFVGASGPKAGEAADATRDAAPGGMLATGPEEGASPRAGDGLPRVSQPGGEPRTHDVDAPSAAPVGVAPLRSVLAITAFQNLFGALFMAPLALIEAALFGVKRPTAGAGLGLGYLIVFCSVLAYLLLNFGLSHVQASKASTFTNLTPIVAVAGAFLLLHERFTPWQGVAAGVVVVGVWLANRGGVAELTVPATEG
jgi:drug/metabolite transporter (DMT)-like permease